MYNLIVNNKTSGHTDLDPAKRIFDHYKALPLSVDTSPDDVEFAEKLGVDMSTAIESEVITITGITHAIPISIGPSGAQYKIGTGGTYTASPGFVKSGDQIKVRMTSSAQGNTLVSAILKVGDESVPF